MEQTKKQGSFSLLANQTLSELETWFDRLEPEGDIAHKGNVLTLTRWNEDEVVINIQEAVEEIWLAHPTGAYHYRYHEGLWQDSRGGKDLISWLNDWMIQASDK
jgi:CyaY protein